MTTPELTVESCLKELREIFPSFDSEITFSTQNIVTVTPWAVDSDGAPLAKGVFDGPTLSEAMAQVRKW